jgi:hypothetical protein
MHSCVFAIVCHLLAILNIRILLYQGVGRFIVVFARSHSYVHAMQRYASVQLILRLRRSFVDLHHFAF